MKNDSYNIVVVSNEDYAPHAATMLCSLFEHNKDKVFDIYYFTDNIIDETRKKFEMFCASYQAHFKAVVCPIEPISDLPVGMWSTMMYFKLYMPTMLPASVGRCLFLDVDMIVTDDIESLYNVELSNKIIAAAEDIPDDCDGKQVYLGLSKDDIYINSGVMVCDIEKWRKLEFQRPIFDFVRSVDKLIRNEQDVIALYFRGLFKVLPIRWNMVTFYFFTKPKIDSKYLPEWKESKRNPGIVHFCAPIKPWFRDCKHPYGHLYCEYRNRTPWPVVGYLPLYENLTLRQRLNKKMKLILDIMGLMHDDYRLKL